MKKCTMCREEKGLGEFFKAKKHKDGLGYWCKKCHTARVLANRNKDLKGFYQKYKAWTAKTWKQRYEKIKANVYRSNARYPERVKARNKVWKAVKAGKIAKLSCMVCGSKKSEAHHYKGYALENWFDIQWVCRKHHRELHRNSH